jgi:3-oxoacyl-[acyl-carrier-protein] synthase II
MVTPIGIGTEAFWNAAIRGTDGIARIKSFDVSDFKTKVGGEVDGFEPADFFPERRIGQMGRGSQFACAALQMALANSGLDTGAENPHRIGVCMGTTMGEPQILRQGIETKYEQGSIHIPAQLPQQYPCSVIAATIARSVGAQGPVIMIPTACAAGNYAIGYAYDLITSGEIDIAIAGGSDPLSKIAFTGFNRLLATTPDKCRPFDLNRNGMAVAEGAGMLVIESLDHALRRGAHVSAEILGYGLGCDAFKMTIPDPTGSGGIVALRRALSNAKITPAHLDYICAHGTGTGENDKSETVIAKTVLGNAAPDIPMSSLKSMIGHTMGAASAIEAIACILMIQHNIVLPTINYETPDPDCDLDYVPNTAREKELSIVASNAYAFAGNTSSIIFGRYT